MAKKWFCHNINEFRISVVIYFASTFQNNGDFPVKMLATFTKIYESKQNWRRPFHEICGVRLCCYLNDFEPLQKEHHIVLPFFMFCEVFYENISENVIEISEHTWKKNSNLNQSVMKFRRNWRMIWFLSFNQWFCHIVEIFEIFPHSNFTWNHFYSLRRTWKCWFCHF